MLYVWESREFWLGNLVWIDRVEVPLEEVVLEWRWEVSVFIEEIK